MDEKILEIKSDLKVNGFYLEQLFNENTVGDFVSDDYVDDETYYRMLEIKTGRWMCFDEDFLFFFEDGYELILHFKKNVDEYLYFIKKLRTASNK